MGEDIFNEQLEIKNGRLRSIVRAAVVVGAVSLQMELRMALIYSVQTSRSILRSLAESKDNGAIPCVACFHYWHKAYTKIQMSECFIYAV